MTAAVIQYARPNIGGDLASAPRPKRLLPVKREPREFRADIQGLRAVAILLVVLYHAQLPGLSGGYVGVDVFFVISGYLITGQLQRELVRTGRVNLLSFYARRARRLLPSALIVITTVVVVARYWGPLLQVKATAWDGIYASIYAINYRLAANGVDYQQAAGPASPLQHFWSLAVEEQFYLLWPALIILGTIVVARRHPRTVRPILSVLAVSGIALSLWYSIAFTHESAPVAYFMPQTRAWEFGVGALIALAGRGFANLPSAFRWGFSISGLAILLAAAVVFDDQTPYPGTAAITPVAATALIIAAGVSDQRVGCGRLLALRPMQTIGRCSYGWYLWHWPVLVLAPTIFGFKFDLLQRLEMCVLAFVLAVVTYVVIERPPASHQLRVGLWLRRTVFIAVGGIALSALVIVSIPGSTGGDFAASPLRLDSANAASELAGLVESSANRSSLPSDLTPSLESAANDVPMTETNCHLGYLQVTQGECAYGDLSATRTIVLFGDSHAQQWDAALDSAAQATHWKLISWTKAACPAADVTLTNATLKRVYTECSRWRQATIQRIDQLRPALVIVSQSDTLLGAQMDNQVWAQKTLTTMDALRSSGAKLDFIADTPIPDGDVPSCLAANPTHIERCERTRSRAFAAPLYTERHNAVAGALRAGGVTVIDPTDWMCSAQRCPTVIGNVLVYRDASHITDSFSRALAPIMESTLAAAASGH